MDKTEEDFLQKAVEIYNALKNELVGEDVIIYKADYLHDKIKLALKMYYNLNGNFNLSRQVVSSIIASHIIDFQNFKHN